MTSDKNGSGKNAYAEMPKNYKIFHHENGCLNHLPVLVAVDISRSMDHTEDGQTKSNIKLAEEMVNQIGQDPELTDDFKRAVDICVMTFAEHVTTVQDWIPLSQYSGDLSLTPLTTTAFHDAVKQSLNAVSAVRFSYMNSGIQCERPQIFIITDGYSTDPKDNPSVVSEAKALCQKYVDTNKVTMHVILLPGGSTSDSKELSSKVMHYKVDDCAYGLPAIKTFINNTLLSFGQAAPDGMVNIVLPNGVKTTRNVIVDNDGVRYVQDKRY